MLLHLDSLILNSQMNNDIAFEELCQYFCQLVIEYSKSLFHKLSKQVETASRNVSEYLLRTIFDKIYEKGALEKSEKKLNLLSHFKKLKENKLKEMEIEIQYIENKAERYDIFMYPDDIK